MIKRSRYIVYNGWCYYCEHLKSDSKWKICIIPLICTNVEEDIRKNIFNLNFLNNYYSKLCHELLEMFDQNEEAIDCIQGEYTYSGRDWCTSETWRFTLPEGIHYDEQFKLARLKREKLPIPAEFQQHEKVFFIQLFNTL